MRTFSANQATLTDERADEEQRLRPQDGGEHLLEAHLAEPEPVGVVADDLGRGERQQQKTQTRPANPTEIGGMVNPQAGQTHAAAEYARLA